MCEVDNVDGLPFLFVCSFDVSAEDLRVRTLCGGRDAICWIDNTPIMEADTTPKLGPSWFVTIDSFL